MEQITDIIKENFPFQPYDIQIQFANKLYNAIENQKFAILESPTGTGKTLSIISGALQWLSENQFNYEKLFKQNFQDTDNNLDPDLPSWLIDTTQNQKQQEKQAYLNIMEEYKESIKQKHILLNEFQNNQLKNNFNKKINIQNKIKTNSIIEQEQQEKNVKKYELQYDSDGENEGKSNFKKRGFPTNQNNENLQEREMKQKFQIIYASKTHSQIQQFVNEIKKTKFGNQYKVLTLASRNNLCVHPDLQKQSGVTLTESCKQKQEKSECQYYKNLKKDQEHLDMLFFNNDKIQDIEEMKQTASKCQVCPYYLSKQSVEYSDIICVPYVSLIDTNTRQSLGINLKNKILILDEAHNLLEASNQIFSKEINFKQILQVTQELQIYLKQYKLRLKAKNQLYINQLLNLCKNIFNFIKNKQSELTKKQNNSNNNSEGYVKIGCLQFMAEIKLDEFDIGKLQRFIEESKLAHKIHYFNLNQKEKENQKQKQDTKEQQNKNNNSQEIQQKPTFQENQQQEQQYSELQNLQEPQILQKFLDFLNFCISESKTNSIMLLKYDSKILQKFTIKLQNLNCFQHIQTIINESYSMILTGGTMEPISEFQLLVDLIGQEKFTKFSCKHVIPKQNFSCYVIPELENTNKIKEKLIFNYETKSQKDSINKLYRNSCKIIQKLSQNIPGGLIVFMQSYQTLIDIKPYMQELKWENYSVFFDTKEGNNQCENILKRYQQTIQQNQKKCILFSVMGGKLSEGINFKDDMARGIIVFGLPYSNKNSPELKEKMIYYDSKKTQDFNGSEYYLNLCMKTVNQTIGRCIRHINDYAITYLVDSRFQDQHIQNKLPQWVYQQLDNKTRDMDQIIEKTKEFFKDKK